MTYAYHTETCIIIHYICLGSRNFPWRSTTGPIRFYNRGEPYYEFTNFYEAVVRIDNDDWLTTEHYFQAQKFVGTPLVGTIQMLERPREAFEKSRDPRYSKWRRSDWQSVKEDVMYKALQAKFTQHEKLRRKLMETGDRELIEHSPYDSYWGDGGNGTGKNRLGQLLMKLRREMKEKQPVQPPQPPPTSVHPEPPKQQVTMGNSSGSNEPNKQPAAELDQHNKDATGQPSGSNTQHSPPPRPRDPQCNTELVIANKAAVGQLPTNPGQTYNVIFTPSSTPTDPKTAHPDPVSSLNQCGSHQAKNDLSNITSLQSAPGDLTSSGQTLTRRPLGSKLLPPPGFPERVLSPPTSYAGEVHGWQPQQFLPSMGIPTAQTQSSYPQNEGDPQLQPWNDVLVQYGQQPQLYLPPSSTFVDMPTQPSYPHNNHGGGAQPQPSQLQNDLGGGNLQQQPSQLPNDLGGGNPQQQPSQLPNDLGGGNPQQQPSQLPNDLGGGNPQQQPSQLQNDLGGCDQPHPQTTEEPMEH